MDNNSFVVSTFYKFVDIADCFDLKLKFTKFCTQNKILGTILIASEGVNSTLTSSREAMDLFYEFIKTIPELADMTFKESYSPYASFRRFKAKIKPEIVTFKMPHMNMDNVGTHLNADEWDALISKPETITIDCRNDYEVEYGSFKGAIDPKTNNFTDLVEWVDKNIPKENKDVPIAMFCTGGIRCEKSTTYMKELGFKNVYHVKGGILQYIEDRLGNENSMWEGKCFVFDDRVAVDGNLRPEAVPKQNLTKY